MTVQGNSVPQRSPIVRAALRRPQPGKSPRARTCREHSTRWTDFPRVSVSSSCETGPLRHGEHHRRSISTTRALSFLRAPKCRQLPDRPSRLARVPAAGSRNVRKSALILGARKEPAQLLANPAQFNRPWVCSSWTSGVRACAAAGDGWRGDEVGTHGP